MSHLPSSPGVPGVPGGQTAGTAPTPPAPLPGTRPQPPLQEVLKGLDSRELEGQTVFDQLFGTLPDGSSRRPQR